MSTLSFIGTGNMSTAIIQGLLKSGRDPQSIIATARTQASLDKAAALGVRTTADNQWAVDHSTIVVVGVKPQMVREVFGALRFDHQMIVSLAAGLPVALFESLCGPRAVVRSMPNTPSLVGQGATGLFANAATTSEQRHQAEAIFSASGLARWVDQEKLIDAVTAASGSGVAYMFAMIEHMIQGAQELGLDEACARDLIAQTMLGAACMTQQSDEPVSLLRERVTSKGGTTAQALAYFQDQGLAEVIQGGMRAAYTRAGELASS
ncbi:MAG: pyrroline-5-carboxylate reductase [Litorivicinus sp.]